MTHYEQLQIMGLEQQIQYHEAMKRNHDEAIAKLKVRIEAFKTRVAANEAIKAEVSHA